MGSESKPVVSVITPVYNGEAFLAECIESVLAQTFQDWEYIILDNRSTDGSAAIAAHYASRDPRVRLVQPEEFVNVYQNFSRAAHLVHPETRYYKYLCADDWMYPECLARMVAVADQNPSVGVVSSYRLEADAVLNDGLLPYTQTVMPGAEVVRRALLGGPYVTGSQSQLLFRADLVRSHDPFFDETVWHSDTDAAFRTLLQCDLGFVHQVLTYTRLHPDARTSSIAHRVNTYIPFEIRMLVRYGPKTLGAEEYRHALRQWLRRYAWFIAKQRLKPSRHSDVKFHSFHKAEIGNILAELGDDWRTRAVLRAVRMAVRNLQPKEAAPRTPSDEGGKADRGGSIKGGVRAVQ